MRILHTSDWHLGRSFHGEGMLEAQAGYIDHLLQVVQDEAVDVVLVAGDVYDRALPPVDAVTLADEALSRLAASRARVVVTSGNHDSARRLGFNSRLVDAAGVHLRTDPATVGTPVLIEDAHGPVAIYGLPYLEPDLLRTEWQLTARSHQSALTEAMVRVRRDLDARGGRSVVMAHAFVAGGEASDSERDISVGGVSMVPSGIFEDISYTALGHLHGRQTISETVRYSGSPLAYSFSEAGHLKGSWLVDLDHAGDVFTEFIAAPVPRRLARLRGTLEELLTSASYDEHEGSWLQATLTDEVRPLQAMDRLRARFPHVASLQFDLTGDQAGASRPPIAGRSAHQVALDFVAQVRGTPADPEESALLQDAFDCCPEDPDLDHVAAAAR